MTPLYVTFGQLVRAWSLRYGQPCDHMAYAWRLRLDYLYTQGKRNRKRGANGDLMPEASMIATRVASDMLDAMSDAEWWAFEFKIARSVAGVHVDFMRVWKPWLARAAPPGEEYLAELPPPFPGNAPAVPVWVEKGS